MQSSISMPVIEQPSLKYERLNKYSPEVAFTIDETISNTIPPITDTGIRDFLRNGINLLRVFPTSNEPNIKAKKHTTGQTVVSANDKPLDITILLI